MKMSYLMKTFCVGFTVPNMNNKVYSLEAARHRQLNVSFSSTSLYLSYLGPFSHIASCLKLIVMCMYRVYSITHLNVWHLVCIRQMLIPYPLNDCNCLYTGSIIRDSAHSTLGLGINHFPRPVLVSSYCIVDFWHTSWLPEFIVF